MASKEAREAAIAKASRIVRNDTSGFLRRAVEPDMTNPLIVSLNGGPGTGKSTTAALLFGRLKQAGINVELVHEVAKDFTWERRWDTLGHQPYVIAKQLRNYDRCYGQVECIITDTSPLLGMIYGKPEAFPTPEAYQAFSQWLKLDWAGRRTLNVFLERDPERGYNPAGRSQTEQEALALDGRIRGLLEALSVPLMDVKMGEVEALVEEVLMQLRPTPVEWRAADGGHPRVSGYTLDPDSDDRPLGRGF